MSLLFKLFPCLSEINSEHLPTWTEDDFPWKILSDGEGGIFSQIGEITESKDGVFIHSSASIGDFVTMEGPCYVGPNAIIRHSAYLRGGSWICDGAIVGNSSEVKNSILLPGAKAPHFNYVGDSILGFEVNLGAGTKLSNVRNDRRGVMVTVEGGFRIDSGLRKLGALIGDGSQLGCNVVTNPGSLLMPGSMIPPNEAISGWNEAKS